MMDTITLKNEFYHCIIDALKRFRNSPENHAVYAMVFDCDASIGQISFRYRNKNSFERNVNQYKQYQQKYGLHGSEYSPSEFDFIEFQPTEFVNHFLDSYYYHFTGDYFGIGAPIQDSKENFEAIFWDMILCTIQRLKTEQKDLGIDTTNHFILFHYDHDQSYEERDTMISMTVDQETMKTLIQRSELQ